MSGCWQATCWSERWRCGRKRSSSCSGSCGLSGRTSPPSLWHSATFPPCCISTEISTCCGSCTSIFALGMGHCKSSSASALRVRDSCCSATITSGEGSAVICSGIDSVGDAGEARPGDSCASTLRVRDGRGHATADAGEGGAGVSGAADTVGDTGREMPRDSPCISTLSGSTQLGFVNLWLSADIGIVEVADAAAHGESGARLLVAGATPAASMLASVSAVV
mmetsp:Transcript_36142/g.90959  ORF Transcript_36142/g.90959 Transcript_36142/m.90959 type:complete len:222 (-) Transcript_36142:332-997(-)